MTDGEAHFWWVLDGFPEIILAPIIALACVMAAFSLAKEIMINRITAIAKTAKAFFAWGTKSSLEDEAKALSELASLCLGLMFAGFAACISLTIVYWVLFWVPRHDSSQGFYANWTSEVSRSFSYFGSYFGCSLWHSWKGTIERLLGWASMAGVSLPNSLVRFFDSNCNELLRLYSLAMGALTATIVTASVIFSMKVAVNSAVRAIRTTLSDFWRNSR